MAGLSRNTKIKATGPMPAFPPADTTMGAYFGQAGNNGTHGYYPGFNGGTAGRAVFINLASTTADIKLLDINGSVTGSGYWAGGLTIAEAAGSANADKWVGFYMDNTDAMLYLLTMDTSVSPNRLYFSKINEAGTVTAIGNAALSHSNLNGMGFNDVNNGMLRRLGGDGSGNFGIYYGKTYGLDFVGGAQAPYRGLDIQISASDGSITQAAAMPNTYGGGYYFRGMQMGPTANNIVGGWSYYNSASASGNTGGFLNLTSGRAVSNVQMGTPFTNGTPYLSATPMPFQWREKYILSGNGQDYGSMVYEVSAMHAWMDEMAVYYGIL